MNNKIRNSLLGLGTGVGLTIAIAQGVSQEQPSQEDLINKKMGEVILSVNTLLTKKGILLPPEEECTVTIIGKQESLHAVLACDGKKILAHEGNVPNGEIYIVQITDTMSQKNGKLNPDKGCFIIETVGERMEGGPSCSKHKQNDQEPIRPIRKKGNIFA